MLESLFNEIASLKACNFIKKKLQHCEFLRAPVPKKLCFCISETQTTNNVIYTLAGNFQF